MYLLFELPVSEKKLYLNYLYLKKTVFELPVLKKTVFEPPPCVWKICNWKKLYLNYLYLKKNLYLNDLYLKNVFLKTRCYVGTRLLLQKTCIWKKPVSEKPIMLCWHSHFAFNTSAEKPVTKNR